MATDVALTAQNDYLGQRKLIGMRDGHERRQRAHRGEPTGGAAVQLELRGAAATDDLDVAPENAAGMAGAERFHRRLLRGKPAGKGNRGPFATGAVLHFAFSEHAPQKPFAVPLDRVGDAMDIRGVQTESENVGPATASA